jgi:hypothetical protein
MEAATVFGRTALQRLQASAKRRVRGNPSLKKEWKDWWDLILDDPAVRFFRFERDAILHDRPPKVGQVLYGPGEPPPEKAEAYYYFDSPDVPATDTIERHLNSIEKLVTDAEARFGTSSLSGRWWED